MQLGPLRISLGSGERFGVTMIRPGKPDEDVTIPAIIVTALVVAVLLCCCAGVVR